MKTILLSGVPFVKSVYGAAGGTTCDLQPAAGEQWVVCWAQGRHDDNGAPRVSGFLVHDGTTQVAIGPGVSIANGICIPLYATNPDGVAGKAGMEWALPLVLNETMHLTLQIVAIGAGKHAILEAMVIKFKGASPWNEPS